MATDIKSLSRLLWKQTSRGQVKKWLGEIIPISYLWIAQIILFIYARSEGVEIPPLTAMLVMLCFLIPDMVVKLIVEKDNTVMDAFLKTRPVPLDLWNRFLALYHFWKPSNLVVPLMLLPACFLFLPLRYGFPVFTAVYLGSVFNGFVVMNIKRRGPYQPENKARKNNAHKFNSAERNFISGLLIKSFMRLKKLRRTIIWLMIMMYLQCLSQSVNNVKSGLVFVLLFVYLACFLPQYGFSVEANFFNGLWTRPISIEKMLVGKFRFGWIAGFVGFVLCLPICLWTDIKVLDLASVTIFSCFFGGLLMFVDAYNCVPMDMFGNSFYKNRNGSGFKMSLALAPFVAVGIGMASIYLLSGWKSQLLLSSLGFAGLIVFRPYVRWMVRRFMSNRYKFMEKYMSQ